MPVSSFLGWCKAILLAMKYALLLVAVLAWALWLGGTIATLVIGKHLFSVLPHDAVAGPAANAMFHVFGVYELVLTGICIVVSSFLLVTYPSKGFLLLLAVFILAAGMVITVALGFMPAMDALIDQQKQHSPEFIKMHVKSMIAMTIQAVLLLLTAPVLMNVIATASESLPGHEPEMDSRSEFEKSKGVPRGL
jgi:hypothetical protein